MSEKSRKDFIKEQYKQYFEMKRMHLTFSWQIPALAIVGVIAFLGFDPSKFQDWNNSPLVLGLLLHVLGFFIGVMYIHHYRNLKFAVKYEEVLIDLEKTYDQ